MKSNTRFIKSVLNAAKSEAPALPFQRGARRAAFIAKRATQEPQRKIA